MNCGQNVLQFCSQKDKNYFVDCGAISSTLVDESTPNLSMRQIDEQRST